MSEVLQQILLRVTELERKLSVMIRIEKIVEVDNANHRVRTTLYNDSNKTKWLPWLSRAAGENSTHESPEVGEQVLLINPSGKPENGVVIPGIYSDAMPAPTDNPAHHLIKFKDDSSILYDTDAHTLTLDIKGAVTLITEGNVGATVGGNLAATVEGGLNASVTGNAVVDAATIKLNDGEGVITGASICHFTGSAHADKSTKVFCGK